MKNPIEYLILPILFVEAAIEVFLLGRGTEDIDGQG